MEKKFTRSRTHKVIAGVLGGMGAYFSIDPNILRVLFVLFVIATGFFPGILAYIIAAIFIPEESAMAGQASADSQSEESASVTKADDDTAV